MGKFLKKIITIIHKFLNSTLDVYVYFTAVIIVILTAYPFWYILVYSLSGTVRSGLMTTPNNFTIEAYRAVFRSSNIYTAFMVSVLRSTIGPVLSTGVSMLVAYALSRRDLPGRKFFTVYFVLTMYFSAGLIPTYLLIRSLGLMGTFWVYIIPGLMNVYGMIIMRTYIEGLPAELQESAYIDGANELVIFFKIIAPLSTPVIATIMLLTTVQHWNAYTDTLLYNASHTHLHTVQYVLVQLVSTVSLSQSTAAVEQLIADPDRVALTPMAVRMAITVVTVIPISLVYPFLQKYFVKGIIIGAVKG